MDLQHPQYSPLFFYHIPGPLPNQDSTLDRQPTDSISHTLHSTANSTRTWTKTLQTSSRPSVFNSTGKVSSTVFNLGDATVYALQEINHSKNFDIDLFKSSFKHANDCKFTVQRCEENAMIENVFQKCDLRKSVGLLIGLAVHYKRDI